MIVTDNSKVNINLINENEALKEELKLKDEIIEILKGQLELEKSLVRSMALILGELYSNEYLIQLSK